MKLRVTDQIQVTSINTRPLQAGDVVDVADDFGAKLLKKHPQYFAPHAEKAALAPLNKMQASPSNKRPGAETPNYEKTNVADLKMLATERKLEVSSCKTKADLIAALVAADAAARKPDYSQLSDEALAAAAAARSIDIASCESREDVIAAIELDDEEKASGAQS